MANWTKGELEFINKNESLIEAYDTEPSARTELAKKAYEVGGSEFLDKLVLKIEYLLWGSSAFSIKVNMNTGFIYISGVGQTFFFNGVNVKKKPISEKSLRKQLKDIWVFELKEKGPYIDDIIANAKIDQDLFTYGYISNN